VSNTTITITKKVAKKLRAAKLAHETNSEMLERLLENEPSHNVKAWLASLESLEGRGVFTPDERRNLRGQSKR
jgi:predicted CopG family antitoxin